MRTVSKRELNQRTAAVLGQVSDSGDVVVTERGKPRWRISAVRVAGTAPERPERDGQSVPPSTEPAPWPTRPGGPAYTRAEADALLGEMRGGH